MKCCAVQDKLKPDRGTSGESSDCTATLSGLIGDNMKACTKCCQEKELKEFHKDKSKKDGHRPNCKVCALKQIKEYQKTERSKVSLGRYHQTAKYKVLHMRRTYRNILLYPERYKARGAVSSAVQAGKLPCIKSLQCHYCPKQAQHYHHYKSYAKDNQFDIIPVCIPCHKDAHKNKVINK